MGVTKSSKGWPDYLRWMRQPSVLGGIGSVMDLNGIVRYDNTRFSPQADMILLRRDGRLLIGEFKRARRKALKENVPQQERLFDPNKA